MASEGWLQRNGMPTWMGAMVAMVALGLFVFGDVAARARGGSRDAETRARRVEPDVRAAAPWPQGASTGSRQPGSTPELFMPGVISTSAHELCVRFDAAMDELYVMRSGLDWHTAILRYRRAGDRWGEPELLSIRVPSGIAYPFLAPDGMRIYFDVREASSHGPAALPDSNLWSATRQGDRWETPVSLGPVVNSASDRDAR